jgi:ABC-type Na+ efflux pump permease subunit
VWHYIDFSFCRPFNKHDWKVAFALNYLIIAVYSVFALAGIFFSLQRIVQQVTFSPLCLFSVCAAFLQVTVFSDPSSPPS